MLPAAAAQQRVLIGKFTPQSAFLFLVFFLSFFSTKTDCVRAPRHTAFGEQAQHGGRGLSPPTRSPAPAALHPEQCQQHRHGGRGGWGGVKQPLCSRMERTGGGQSPPANLGCLPPSITTPEVPGAAPLAAATSWGRTPKGDPTPPQLSPSPLPPPGHRRLTRGGGGGSGNARFPASSSSSSSSPCPPPPPYPALLLLPPPPSPFLPHPPPPISPFLPHHPSSSSSLSLHSLPSPRPQPSLKGSHLPLPTEFRRLLPIAQSPIIPNHGPHAAPSSVGSRPAPPQQSPTPPRRFAAHQNFIFCSRASRNSLSRSQTPSCREG